MRICIFLILFAGSSWSVFALESGRSCFEGCLYALNCLDFNDTNPALSRQTRTCQSVLRATSLYLCVEKYCTDEGRANWLNKNNATCQTSTGVSLPPYDVIAGHDFDGVRRLKAEEGMCGSAPIHLGEPTIPDDLFFERAFRTLEAAFFEDDIHWTYAIAMYYFWGTVVSIGIFMRLTSLLRGLQTQEWQPIPDNESDSSSQENPNDSSIRSLPYALLKRYIVIPAVTFGYRCSQNIRWCTIPPRIQSLTIASFVLLNIVLCCISYSVFENNIFWPKVSKQLFRYVSDRTGIISLANIPLIWLFGTRNNTLIWLTGWGFGTYNNFHRCVARVATVQAVVHSLGYMQMIWEDGGWRLYEKYRHEKYFFNGKLATIFMCAICAFSVYGLRRSHYEIFLVTHIVFSAIVLITMYYHVEIFRGEYNVFIWPSVFIWLFDRGLRIFRILAFNPRFWNTKCSTTYDAKSNLVRLEVPCSQSFLKPKPGAYYYVYAFDNLLYAHQSHPFTLAYVSEGKESDTHPDLSSTTPRHPRRPRPHRASSNSSLESDALLPHSPISSHTPSSSLVFLIRPYNGFTSRLARLAALKPTPHTLHALIEGPYGNAIPLRTFPSVLFLVGGTGIAVPLSYLSNLLTSSQSRVVRLRIVWAVREHSLFVDVLNRFRDLLADERVEVDVHVTRDEEGKDDDMVEGLDGVDVVTGRPDIDAHVDETARLASGGRLAVVACGPASMADEARRACVRAVGDGYRGVEYFEESFKW
ncbi:hypothetical protein K504DRAFT_456908 [Pleomassaria siparia CBS 279.74]|uniref:FAD-binding FR-type domain-containing protein n=1 Tax=Pleomassaria siparia CBS 279.74 TaxID=1314801 RepID=A0A6G1KQF1_9PLEO|nr:hypothetical protein K504DRAFT_456908 [Pleomassaria siparia CBS 279.74]